MKNIKNIPFTIVYMAFVFFACISCEESDSSDESITPIEFVGIPGSYASLPENTNLVIPIKFTSAGESDLASANYKVVSNRMGVQVITVGPEISIPVNGKSVDATITVPVRKGLMAVVVSIYDKAGVMSHKSASVKSVVPSDSNVKTLTNVVMSTDPADNQNFFSMYEPTPVFGNATALTKQNRIDMIVTLNNGIRSITAHGYAINSDYYNGTPGSLNAGSKSVLAGFTTLTYTCVTTSRSYLTRAVFDAIAKESDLNTFMDTVVIGYAPHGNNYNLVALDRRNSDAFTETAVDKGFIIGWGYHAAPPSTVALNESFGLVMVKSVTKKPNGHYVMTFDVKAPPRDQRADYNASSIAPYDPYPL